MAGQPCPNCSRDIEVSNRITGDEVWCPCGAIVRVMHLSGSTYLRVTSLARPVPNTAAKARPRRRR